MQITARRMTRGRCAQRAASHRQSDSVIQLSVYTPTMADALGQSSGDLKDGEGMIWALIGQRIKAANERSDGKARSNGRNPASCCWCGCESSGRIAERRSKKLLCVDKESSCSGRRW